jgi:mannose/fructose/N-acetylgalactosamine-specific phosphotransferase system component IID
MTSAAKADTKGRKLARGVLLVVAGIMLVLSVVAVWTRNFLLNTDRYVETVAPLADDPAIQEAAAARIADEVTKAIDVQSILDDLLPSGAGAVLAGPIESALGTAVDTASARILDSDAFQKVWDEANRIAHVQVRRLLTGEGNIEVVNGRVVLDLTPIIQNVMSELEDRGIGIVKNIPINQVAIQLNLFNADNLEKVNSATDLLQKLSYVLPILMIICVAAAVWLSRERRRTWVAVGVTFMISALILAVGIRFGRSAYLDSLTELDVSKEAASSAFDIVTRFLRTGVRFLFFLGVAFVIVAWVLGPSSSAQWVRDLVLPRGERTGEGGGVSRFVAAHQRGLQWVALVLVALLVISRDHPKGWTVFWALVVLGGAVVVIEWIAARAPLSAGSHEPGDGSSDDAGAPPAGTPPNDSEATLSS